MRSIQQFSITLPSELADAVKAKVASGEYANEREVICEGLRVLFARDRAIETWLLKQVVPTAQALAADPNRALTPDQVRASLAEARRRHAAARG